MKPIMRAAAVATLLRLLTALTLMRACTSCSYFTNVPFGGRNVASGEHKWTMPKIVPEKATDEAVMLIGGKHCAESDCSLRYSRLSGGAPVAQEHVFRPLDRTIKFFTRYGFCRVRDSSLPVLPQYASGLGAVAMPDGRVLMCGGSVLDPRGGERAVNTTLCWYWIYRTNFVVETQMFSKLPFQWLGPLTPSIMKIVNFKRPKEAAPEPQPEPPAETNNSSTRRKSKQSRSARVKREGNARAPKRTTPKTTVAPDSTTHRNQLSDRDCRVTRKSFPVPQKDASQGPQKIPSDAFWRSLQARMENVRILILPWPVYTDAFKVLDNGKQYGGGGTVVVGRFKIAETGPRFYWKKHQLDHMAMGHGGCYEVEELDNGNVRVHTFGGREVHVNFLLQDEGWTQNPHQLNKYSRYIELGLQRSSNSSKEGYQSSWSGDVYFAQLSSSGLGEVFRPTCCSSDGTPRNRPGMEKSFLQLNQDRVFHSCHLLPAQHSRGGGDASSDVVVVGGGTAVGAVADHDRLRKANYAFTPIYREVARYQLKPAPSDLGDCAPASSSNNSADEVRGRWTENDLAFGFGLNVPRTRHASQIIKTKDVITGEPIHTLYVFGGFSGDYGKKGVTLDTVESFQLGTSQNFKIYDVEREANDWRFRLPWPLMDMASVKIPVEWLPKECYAQYLTEKKKEINAQKKGHDDFE